MNELKLAQKSNVRKAERRDMDKTIGQIIDAYEVGRSIYDDDVNFKALAKAMATNKVKYGNAFGSTGMRKKCKKELKKTMELRYLAFGFEQRRS